MSGNITQNGELKTVKIDSDLSSKQYHFVDMDATDDDVVNLKENGTSNSAFVLVDDGNGATTALSGSICVSGVTKVKLGGTAAAGAFVMPTTAGKAIAATDGNYFSGRLLKGGVDGDIVPMQVEAGYLETT